LRHSSAFSAAKRMSIFHKLELFHNFYQHELERIAENAEFFIAEPSEVIIELGAHDTCFYLLLSGRASVRLQKDGDPVMLVGPGQMVGEMGFVLSTERTSWVLAEDLCILLRVDQSLMKQLDCGEREKLKDQIIIKLATSIQQLNAKLGAQHYDLGQSDPG